MSARSSRFSRWLLAVVLVAAAAFCYRLWLPWFGEFLVQAGPPAKADIVVVLAGDYSGSRILKGAELVRSGYAPRALVSGPSGMYGFHEDELAIGWVTKQGYPASLFEGLPNDSRSTREEALVVVPELRRRGVHSFILVTSETHTRRAASVYRELGGGLTMYVVAAPLAECPPHSWWRDREGRKVILFEWLKTMANWVRL